MSKNWKNRGSEEDSHQIVECCFLVELFILDCSDMKLVQLALHTCLSGLWFLLSVSLGRLAFKTSSFVFQLRSNMACMMSVG